MLDFSAQNLERTLFRYENGIDLLARGYADLNSSDLDAIPVAGAWSPRHLLAHLTDFEPLIAFRLKIIIAVDNPLILGYDERAMATSLNYAARPVELEMDLFRAVRLEFLIVARALPLTAWSRTAVHNELGRLNLWQYFQICCGHLESHLVHLDRKRLALERPALGVQVPLDYPGTWIWQK